MDTELALARQTIHKRTVVATAAKTNRPLHLKVSMDDAVGMLPSAIMLAQLSAAGESTADPGPCVPVGLVHAYDACAPPTV
ncbi:hypothetical protein [Mesorhizobium sp. 1M-11]|uniref:hypothetical protein n=1 Tax=Mesorhizobium sp. 1M-11 TaxID=1529006 RepID=UPI0006C75FB9|nr:hypothetical protein [Mesorhizobium sp. 1M-11]